MFDDGRIEDILLSSRLLDDEQLANVRAVAQSEQRPLYLVALESGYVQEDRAVMAVARAMRLRCVSLGEFEMVPELRQIVPFELARRHQVLPIGVVDERTGRKLFLGMVDPIDMFALDEVGSRTGMAVVPVLVGPSDLARALQRCYGPGSGGHAQVSGPPISGDYRSPDRSVRAPERPPPSGQHPVAPTLPDEPTTSPVDTGELPAFGGRSEVEQDGALSRLPSQEVAGVRAPSAWDEVELDDEADSYLTDIFDEFDREQGSDEKPAPEPTSNADEPTTPDSTVAIVSQTKKGELMQSFDELGSGELDAGGTPEPTTVGGGGGYSLFSPDVAARDKALNASETVGVFSEDSRAQLLRTVEEIERSHSGLIDASAQSAIKLKSPDFPAGTTVVEAFEALVKVLVRKGVITELDIIAELRRNKKE